MSTKTGVLLDKQRVSGIESGGNPVYASPVAINGKLYMQTRTRGLFVLDGTPKNECAKSESICLGRKRVQRQPLAMASYSQDRTTICTLLWQKQRSRFFAGHFCRE